MFTKQKVGNIFAVLLAEFLGTGALTYVFLRMQHSNIGVAYFIAVAAGLALAVATFMFVSKSGAHFNPAVTIGLWVSRQVKTLPSIAYIVAQLFGAWVAYQLFNYLFSQPVQALYTNQASWELHTFTAEAVGALIFALGWAAALHRAKNTHAFAGYVGAAFAIGVLIASVASFGLVNPAAALGTRVWHIWSGAAWGTYVLGPIVGSIVGFGLYEYLFAHDKVGLRVAGATNSKKTTASSSKSKSTSTKKKPAAKKTTSRKK